MIEWLKYLGIYLGIFIVAALVYQGIVDSIVLIVTGKGVTDEKTSSKLQNAIFIFWIIVPFISTYFIMDYNGISPPIGQNTMILNETVADDKIESLTNEIDNISQTLTNIDDLTISEIQHELSRTRDFIQELKEETVKQKQVINDLRTTFQEEKQKADNAIKYAERVQSLTDEQIDIIRELIIADTKKESEKSFWIGAAISFPIGVIASIIGSLILGFFRKRN